MKFITSLLALSATIASAIADPAAPTPDCPHEITQLSLRGGSDAINNYLLGDFNVVSRNNVVGANGDIEGRLLAGGDVSLTGGYSVGMELSTCDWRDYPRPWSVVVGGDLCWERGYLWPDGGNGNTQEGIWVGGALQAVGSCGSTADNIANRVTGGPGDLSTVMTNLWTDVQAIADGYAAMSDNANYMSKWGGAFINCGGEQLRYYLTMTMADFNAKRYFSLNQCNVLSEYVITITGSGTAVFKDGEFPGVSERVVFNLPDATRVELHGGWKGTILAPRATYYNPYGVSRGFVIVNDVELIYQANKPVDCGVCDCCDQCYEHDEPSM